MRIPDLTTPTRQHGRNVALIGKIELTTLWTQKITWIFFVTATTVFVAVYLIKIVEFQNLWNTGPTNDIFGGSPFHPFSKALLTDQTKPSGPGANALDFVLDQIVAQIVFDRASFFSITELLSEDLYRVYSDLWHGREFAGKYFEHQSVWWAAETVALSDVASLPDIEIRQKVL